MREKSQRPPGEVESMINEYGDMLFRICLVMLKNKSDAEDAVQDVALKYILNAPPFESREHEKAWLIKVAANRCRDVGRFWARHPQAALDELRDYVSEPESLDVVEALMAIPEKFRIVMVLHYVEGYRVEDIAAIIGKTASAVKMRLQKGRGLLEEEYLKGDL